MSLQSTSVKQSKMKGHCGYAPFPSRASSCSACPAHSAKKARTNIVHMTAQDIISRHATSSRILRSSESASASTRPSSAASSLSLYRSRGKTTAYVANANASTMPQADGQVPKKGSSIPQKVERPIEVPSATGHQREVESTASTANIMVNDRIDHSAQRAR